MVTHAGDELVHMRWPGSALVALAAVGASSEVTSSGASSGTRKGSDSGPIHLQLRQRLLQIRRVA